MCGIAGIVDPRAGPELRERCDAMRDGMAHRGPDDAGTFVDHGGQTALASRRLAIIDLSPAGHQPMLSHDGRLALVFNGEIYNYRELRADLLARGRRLRSESDTEVILDLYEELGERCLDRLNGMFALALWDARAGCLWLARDRLGEKPLLYARLPGGGLAFASEFQALLRHPEVSREVSLPAIDFFLRYGYVPAPLSGFASISKLPPGCWLRWRTGQTEQASYWQAPVGRPRAVDERAALAELGELLADSVQRRMISDVPLGAFLSGGLDSASVVGLMAEHSERPVKTFTIGFGDPRYNELAEARRVADWFGTDHQEFVVEPRAAEILPLLVRHYGEPYADSSALPTYYLSQQTRQHVTVALSGDGGDEVLAGYDRYRAAAVAARVRRAAPLPKAAFALIGQALPGGSDLRTPARRLRRFVGGLAHDEGQRYTRWMNLFDPALLDAIRTPEFRAALHRSEADRYLAAPIEQRNGASLLAALTRLDLTSYLPNDLLVKADIATMASSLEGRMPFLDHRLVEWASSLPDRLRLRGGQSKYLLRQLMRGRLPAATLSGPKRGFGVPVSEWLRTDLRPLLEASLLSEQWLLRGYLLPGATRRLVAEHIQGTADHGRELWALLCLELWHQQFVD
jgi:asparagine synthase (glutamine-hydrolysing)